ncbi:UNVERIFIED_CONTAM: hypothetical protein FKN15_033596 [Acipenser sinensis]
MSLTSSTPSRTSAPDRTDKKIDNFLKKDYSAATASMRINNYQIHVAKYQHILWSQLSDALQTTTPESVEMAMQLAEEGKNAAKIQLCDNIDTNARAVANVISARRCLQMKSSSLTSDMQSKVLEFPFQGELLLSMGLKDSLAHMKEARQAIRSCATLTSGSAFSRPYPNRQAGFCHQPT